MNITFHPNFKKVYKKRFAGNNKLINRFNERTVVFISDLTNPTLHNHHLTGSMRQFWSFSITGDIRVVYKIISENEVEFFDIGSHNQVY